MNLRLFSIAALLAPAATAQVTYGTDDAAQMDNFSLDLGSGVSTGPVYTDSDSWGIGDDPVAGVYYINDGAALSTHPLGVIGGAVTPLGTIMMAGAAQSMTGLAYENGILYGHRNIATEALYTIDTVTLEATPVLVYSTTSIDLGGLDIDPATGLVYATEDSSSYSDPGGTSGPGLLALDVGAGTETFVGPYPPGETDIDGLAFNPNGTAYLLEDEPAPIHTLDLMSGTFDPMPPMNAILGSEIFSAGTFTDGGSGGIGTPYCMANPNSTGSPGSLGASGSQSVMANDVTLEATGLPPMSFGFFITSQTQDFIPNPAGSAGNLCLGGSIGRYVGPGQIQQSDAGGAFSLTIDLTNTPQPMGSVSVNAGETWNYQAWHRDTSATGPTSNFTNGLEVIFTM